MHISGKLNDIARVPQFQFVRPPIPCTSANSTTCVVNKNTATTVVYTNQILYHHAMDTLKDNTVCSTGEIRNQKSEPPSTPPDVCDTTIPKSLIFDTYNVLSWHAPAKVLSSIWLILLRDRSLHITRIGKHTIPKQHCNVTSTSSCRIQHKVKYKCINITN